MYANCLPFLRCPLCGGTLDAHVSQHAANGEILEAVLACSCGQRFPVASGIADFLGTASPATPAQAVNEWRLAAWGYERLWRPFALTVFSGQRFPYRRELPLIAAMLQPQRGGLLLDIACSNGLYARAMVRAGGAAAPVVAAVDHSLPMLLDARQRALAANLPISFVRAEAQALPFASAAAAGAAIGGSLNEIGDLPGCLSEAARVLAPSGRLVTMSLVAAESRVGRLLQRVLGGGGLQFPSAAALLALFRANGLHIHDTQRFRIVLFAATSRL